MRRYSRLLRMGPREVGGRLIQEINARGDRLRAALSGPNEPGDDLFRRTGLQRSAFGSGSPGLWQAFRERTSSAPFLGLRDPAGTMALVRTSCRSEVERILLRAEEVADGGIRLLGREVRVGPSVDWHLEPVSGLKVPLRHWTEVDHLDPEVSGEYKVLWELNRHQYFLALGQAFALTGDEKYARVFRDHLVSWMDQNPPSWGIHWSSSLELSYRAIAWIWGLYLFRDSDLMEEAIYLRCLKILELQGRHIERYMSTYFSPNTHLTGEALGLFYLGVCFPELQRAEHWKEFSSRVLTQQLGIQLRPDGTHFEQASAYHAYTVDIYLHAYLLRRHAGLPPNEGSWGRLPAALDFLRSLVRPDGLVPLLGDDDGGRLLPLVPRAASDFSDTLSVGGFLFQRGDLLSVSPQPTPESILMLGAGVLAGKPEPRPPSGTTRSFPDGGFFLMRDGWGHDSNYAVVSCGPHGSIGGGHAHADALSVEVAVKGALVVVDPGTFTYRSDSESRARLRAPEAHNSVVVDGTPVAISGGPFSWRRTADARMERFLSGSDFDFFQGAVDHPGESGRAVLHRRSILFVRGRYFLIWDRVEGEGRHTADVRYHLAPDVQADLEGDRLVLRQDGNQLAALLFFGARGGRAERFDTVVCQGYGEKKPSIGVRWSHEGVGPLDVVSVISLAPHELTARRLPAPGAAICLEVRHGSEDEMVMLDQSGPLPEDPVLAQFPEMSAEAWLFRLSRGSNGESLRALALAGRRFHVGRDSLLDGRKVEDCREWALGKQHQKS